MHNNTNFYSNDLDVFGYIFSSIPDIKLPKKLIVMDQLLNTNTEQIMSGLVLLTLIIEMKLPKPSTIKPIMSLLCVILTILYVFILLTS